MSAILPIYLWGVDRGATHDSMMGGKEWELAVHSHIYHISSIGAYINSDVTIIMLGT